MAKVTSEILLEIADLVVELEEQKDTEGLIYVAGALESFASAARSWAVRTIFDGENHSSD